MKKKGLVSLFGNVKGYVLPTILSPLFMIGEVIFEVLIPAKMAVIVNYIQTAKPQIEFILQSGLIMIAMALASLLCGMASAYVASKASVGFSSNVRRSLFYKIQGFTFKNVDTFSTASLVTRCTTDVNNVQVCFMQLIRIMVRAPLMFALSIVMAFNIDSRMALIFVVAVPLLVATVTVSLALAFPKFKKLLKGYDEMNQDVQENLINIRVVKSFVREDYEKEKFRKGAGALLKWQIAAERIFVLQMPLMQLVMYGCKLAITGIGGTFAIEGTLEIGNLSAMITYAVQILNSLMMLSNVAVTYVTSRASIFRICEVLQTNEDMKDGTNNRQINSGSISFCDVDFSYDNNIDDAVLKNINLNINSGETVGIIGGTGSGKSSLVQLIPRLYDVDKGDVFVDGINVKEYSMQELRSNVAMVLQKNILFSGTIADNLRWGDANATEQEIIDACKACQAHQFIMSFPNGYDALLGQGGVNISGGQKQRLCIARALLKKPKILILDDSTSAVDTNTDTKIRQELKNIPNVTKIIIAQRVDSVIACDKIVVLDKGQIVSVGSHEQLLNDCKIYQEVYYSQEGGAK
ncbi:MAG: ABC transporter ATP-binding protein [Clostridia bacterium]